MKGEKASSVTFAGNPSARYSHRADGVFAAKGYVGKAGPVEGAVVNLAIGFDAQGEALIERRFRLRRMGIVGVAGADVLVENVPVPEFAVAAEVELAGAEAADGHPDQGGFGAAVDLRLAAGGQGANPVGRQFFVEGDESPRLLRRERAGHEAGLADEGERAEAEELEKFTAVRGVGGTLGFHAIGLMLSGKNDGGGSSLALRVRVRLFAAPSPTDPEREGEFGLNPRSCSGPVQVWNQSGNSLM